MPTWPAAGDYGGMNISVNSSVTTSGIITGIATLTVPSGNYIAVTPFDGTNGGTLEIHCRTFKLFGTLNATGAGYGGGSGGSGYARATNGSAYAGGGVGITFDNSPVGAGGGGGLGGGPAGGPGGAPNHGAGLAGGTAGYMAVAANGDSTTDTSVIPGSGGGGGGGAGDAGYDPGGGGGGAGGYGGGCIKIYASNIVIYSTGTIISNQATSGNGGEAGRLQMGGGGGGVYPAAGGAGSSTQTGYPPYGQPGTNTGTSSGGYGFNTNTLGPLGAGGAQGANGSPGYNGATIITYGGGGGGFGAGGGVLLYFSKSLTQATAVPKVYVAGTINNAGGAGTSNGGSVKIFTPKLAILGTISSGRVLRPDVSDTHGARSVIPPLGIIS